MIIGVNATAPWVQCAQVSDSVANLIEWDSHNQVERLPIQLQAWLTNNIVLKGLLVILGPGAYTGIRLSLTALKMLSLVHGCPLLGMSLFDAYVSHCHGNVNELMVLASPSRKGMLNVQIFQSSTPGFNSISSLLQLPIDGFGRFLSRFESKVSCHYFGPAFPVDVGPNVNIQLAHLDLLSLIRIKKIEFKSGIKSQSLAPIYSSPAVA
jgi:hypothetical protein